MFPLCCAVGAAAVAYPAPGYQWCQNGVPIEGATSPSFSLPRVTEAEEGTYTCKISNAEGSVESAPTLVEYLRTAPAIVTHPAALSAGLGDTVTLSVHFGF